MTTATTHSIRHIARCLERHDATAIEALKAELLASALAQNTTEYSIALDSWNERALTVVLKTAAGELPYRSEATDQHTILTFAIKDMVDLIARLVTADGVPLPPELGKLKTPSVESRLISDMHSLASGICCMFDVTLSL
jgi:hypothetical protein